MNSEFVSCETLNSAPLIHSAGLYLSVIYIYIIYRFAREIKGFTI